MEEPTRAVLEECIALIERLRSGELDDEQLSDVVMRLRSLLPDPGFMDYTVDRIPELKAEDVVRKAFAYKPIRL